MYDYRPVLSDLAANRGQGALGSLQTHLSLEGARGCMLQMSVAK
jgi:hypothetical protein